MSILHSVKDFYGVYIWIIVNDFVMYATHKDRIVIGFALGIIFSIPCRLRFFPNNMTFHAKYDILPIINFHEFSIARFAIEIVGASISSFCPKSFPVAV